MPNLSPVLPVATYVLFALVPLHRPAALGLLTCVLAFVVNELPFVAAAWLAVWTAVFLADGELAGGGAWIYWLLTGLTLAGLVVIVARGAATAGAAARALAQAGIPGASRPERWGQRLLRVLLAPVPLRGRGVERLRGLSYGPDPRFHRLDLYRARAGVPKGVLLQFHGGGFSGGGRSRESRHLLFRLAREGWLCLSADYRLRDAAAFPHPLVDAKRAIAWSRLHAADYGGDPRVVAVAGSSAGAQLALLAALTPNDAAYQPGFEGADTSVDAVIGLYGYYGPQSAGAVGPADRLSASAPPVLVVHGSHDTLVPVEDARDLAAALRATSRRPVAYLELPGAQHTFDWFRSWRFEAVVDVAETFLADAARADGAR